MVYVSEESAVRRIAQLRRLGMWPGYYRVRGGWRLSYDPPQSMIELNRNGYLSLGTDTMHDG